ncbi:10494_t:CDS:2, partial [Funneliformis caledonium]
DELFSDDDELFAASVNLNYNSGQDNSNIDPYQFKDFPSMTYMARKLLNIRKKSKSFAICTDCNKLYDITSIIPKNPDNNTTIGFKCTYIEFSNHPMQSYCKSCDSELLMKVLINNGYIWHPKIIFQLPCLKTQLSTMYQRPGFEELLK